GKAPLEIEDRAKNARFDERLALLGLMLDAVTDELRNVNLAELTQTELLNALKIVRTDLANPKADGKTAVDKQIEAMKDTMQKQKLASSLSQDGEYAYMSAISELERMNALLEKQEPADGAEAFKILKAEFDGRTKELKKLADKAGKCLSNLFKFCEKVFGDGHEMLILVTELTISYYGARFISRYGCVEYFAHNKELLFHERQKEIIAELEKLEI
ncbi:MAG: ATPase, partial [Clostridia bacterium]|nr:ATPase [Clostridia bacterium]